MAPEPRNPRDVPAGDLDPLEWWLDHLETPQLKLELPIAQAASQLTWCHAGSSDVERNGAFLRTHLPDTDEGFLRWLSEPTSAPAYWSNGDATELGVRTPFEMGAKGFVGGAGIPEDLGDLDLLAKLAVVGTTVVTTLGLHEEIAYELPASMMIGWAPDADRWAAEGATAFAFRLFRDLLADIAWHHTSIQTFTGDPLHQRWAKTRLRSTVIMEAHLTELSIQRDIAREDDCWFTSQDSQAHTGRTASALALATDRLRHARELERDQIQLDLLTATHALSLAEQRHREAREEATRATEDLTRRITVVSAVFLPATLMVGLLGSNWGEAPLPGGWDGLGIALALALAASLSGLALLWRRSEKQKIDTVETQTLST